MSDEWGQQDGATAAAEPSGETAGALLRAAREAAGLHIAALAVALKVPVRKLEALEEDRYDLMTDSVFVRGLASSVCRTLKIDPQPILERLPQRTAPRLVRDNDGINTPFRAPSDGPPATWVQQMTRPVYLAVFALLLGALILVLLPTTRRDEAIALFPKQEAAEPAAMPAPFASAPVVDVPVASSTPDAAAAPTIAPSALAAASGPIAASTAGASSTASAPAPVIKVAASAPVAVAAARVASAPAAVIAQPTPSASASGAAGTAAKPASAAQLAKPEAPATGIVVLRATAPTWVEVTDAKGATSVRRMLDAGETVSANGPLPVKVVVGKSDAATVLVRGKPFDLKPFTRADNLARFEVK